MKMEHQGPQTGAGRASAADVPHKPGWSMGKALALRAPWAEGLSVTPTVHGAETKGLRLSELPSHLQVRSEAHVTAKPSLALAMRLSHTTVSVTVLDLVALT